MTFGLLVIRLVGLVFAAHGAQKLFGWFGGPGINGLTAGFQAMGLRPARLHAISAGIFEFGGGLLLAFGLLTPVAALVITATMTTAVIVVHLSKGFFAAQGGYEFNLVLVLVAVGIAATGPGEDSLDNVFGIDWSGAGWALIALGLGLIGGTLVVWTSRAIVARETPAPSDAPSSAPSA